MARVLVLTASVGEGHDSPARMLAAALRDAGADAVVADGLAAMGRLLAAAATGAPAGPAWWFDLQYRVTQEWAPGRTAASVAATAAGGRGLLRLVRAAAPDVVASTYPICTEVLGRLRRRGRLAVPVAGLVTDLSGLAFWAAPGVDLHLLTHPESEAEVRALTGGGPVRVVRGLTSPGTERPHDPAVARAALGLPATGRVVAVSGGGWGMGDLEGAIAEALAAPGVTAVVCLCGRNDALRARLAARFAGEPRLRPVGFTDRMGEHLAAADALVHATGGLTVLEALVQGTRVVSFGWSAGHVRVNEAAFARLGLARVARTRAELAGALRAALDAPRRPDAGYARRPAAADAVLELTRGAGSGCGA